MTYKSEIGQLGENIACGYLVKNKYKVIERNFRQKWGEIDIIVKAPDRTLVFVEVKTVQGVEKLHTENDDKHISAEDQLTAAKLQKLQRTASLYTGHNQDLINNKKGWRIDLIAITLKVNGEPIKPARGELVESTCGDLAEPLTLLDNHYVIKHYKNI